MIGGDKVLLVTNHRWDRRLLPRTDDPTAKSYSPWSDQALPTGLGRKSTWRKSWSC